MTSILFRNTNSLLIIDMKTVSSFNDLKNKIIEKCYILEKFNFKIFIKDNHHESEIYTDQQVIDLCSIVNNNGIIENLMFELLSNDHIIDHNHKCNIITVINNGNIKLIDFIIKYSVDELQTIINDHIKYGYIPNGSHTLDIIKSNNDCKVILTQSICVPKEFIYH